jgi:hypothetical protein
MQEMEKIKLKEEERGIDLNLRVNAFNKLVL